MTSLNEAFIQRVVARSIGVPDILSEEDLRLTLVTFLDIWRGGFQPGNPLVPAANRIPLPWSYMENLYPNIIHLIPGKRKQDLPHLRAGGGYLHDPWATLAETQIIRDMRKYATPIHLSEVRDLSSLSHLKGYKVMELLYRASRKEKGDKFDEEYNHFRMEYADELASMPFEVAGDEGSANVQQAIAVTRCS